VTADRAPLMAAGIFRQWQGRAAALELDPGDATDVGAAAFAADVPAEREFGPYLPAEAPLILAHLEGMARWRRSAWRVSVERGTLTIQADPAGRVDDLSRDRIEGSVVAELRDQARVERYAWIRCQINERQAAGGALETTAIALGVSLATLNRARRGVTDTPSVSLEKHESGGTPETSRSHLVPRPAHNRTSPTDRSAA
jgi:hypothetical protein